MDNQVVISKDFFKSLNKLSKTDRNNVINTIEKLESNPASSGLNMHKLINSSGDESFRSIRVNRNLRIILSHQGDVHILLYVDNHDDAYNWAEGKAIDKTKFGALYINDKIYENQKIEEVENLHNKYSYSYNKPLFESRNISYKDLMKLGITENQAKSILKISDETIFLEFLDIFPEELKEGLIDIYTGDKNITEVYAELNTMKESDGLNNTNSKRRFYRISNKEIEALKSNEVENWSLFLHPDQEKIVYGDYNGPVLVEGGPGTGKSVVGLYRSVYLAKEIFNHENQKILMCTFSKKLAKYLNQKIKFLAGQKGISNNNIEVYGVDSVIYKVLRENNIDVGHYNFNQIYDTINKAYENNNVPFSKDFFIAEYEEIIQKYNINSLEQYLEVQRINRRIPLRESRRKTLWSAYKEIIESKKRLNLLDFDDRAGLLLKHINNGKIKPIYESAIIDEAQDLSITKIKAIFSLVKNDTNNLMMLSDQNQRIYSLNNWKKETGLNIVGRTYYLYVNYRTTHQIRKFADSQFIETKKDGYYIKGYKSIFDGPEPIVEIFNNNGDQYKYILNLLDNIDNKESTCIVSERKEDLDKLAGVLNFSNIKHQKLFDEKLPTKSGLYITTMHGCKGLEFDNVIVMNYSEVGIDILVKDLDDWYINHKIRNIECLKYVAVTRAKNSLYVLLLE